MVTWTSDSYYRRTKAVGPVIWSFMCTGQWFFKCCWLHAQKLLSGSKEGSCSRFFLLLILIFHGECLELVLRTADFLFFCLVYLTLQVRGFKPGRSHRIFKGEKILSTPFFGGEVKPSVPRRRFAACKRCLELRGSRILDEICGNISRPRRVPPSAARGLVGREGT